MPIYHPALDPYHSAFRMLQILGHNPNRAYDAKALRILDFYAVFPQLIVGIRLPKEQVTWRKPFANLGNPYWFSGDAKVVFSRMEPLQRTALDLLYAQGFIDPEIFASGQVRVLEKELAKVKLRVASTISRQTLDFLVNVLGYMPFQGVGGLKDRTKLLEYRYDAV